MEWVWKLKSGFLIEMWECLDDQKGLLDFRVREGLYMLVGE